MQFNPIVSTSKAMTGLLCTQFDQKLTCTERNHRVSLAQVNFLADALTKVIHKNLRIQCLVTQPVDKSNFFAILSQRK